MLLLAHKRFNRKQQTTNWNLVKRKKEALAIFWTLLTSRTRPLLICQLTNIAILGLKAVLEFMWFLVKKLLINSRSQMKSLQKWSKYWLWRSMMQSRYVLAPLITLWCVTGQSKLLSISKRMIWSDVIISGRFSVVSFYEHCNICNIKITCKSNHDWWNL